MRDVRGRATFGGAPWAALAAAAVLLAAPAARATDTVVPAGQSLTLTADLVLQPTDTFTAGDASGARCAIHGAGHSITSVDDMTMPFLGTLAIHNCDIDGLGLAGAPAISLTTAGSAAVTIAGSTFSMSGSVKLEIDVHTSVVFAGNTIAKDSVVPAVIELADSGPVFFAEGTSDGPKSFQGNYIFKSRATFSKTNDWLVGGPAPGQGNVFLGTRAGIDLEQCSGMKVVGNYSHTLTEGADWNQVKNVEVNGGDTNVIEHNVFWGRNWLIDLSGPGELRYNLLINAVERGWVLTEADAGAKIHHNVAIATRDSTASPNGGFVVDEANTAGAPPSTEVYNNTLDTADTCTPAFGGAVVMNGDAVLASLRSNALVGGRVITGPGAATVNGGGYTTATMLPVHLLYTDYNLFFNPDSPAKLNYGVSVVGKTVRVDAGDGLHDVTPGGAVDQQVDPRFAGPVPRVFPFDEAAISAGKTTVCQILAFYRKVYAPSVDSPLTGAGDPAEGAGNDVGAIGAGTDNALDLFGKLCDPTDVGTPVLPADATTCPAMGLTGGPPGGDGDPGDTMVPAAHGFVCACETGAGDAHPLGVALLLGVMGLAASLRRRAQ